MACRGRRDHRRLFVIDLQRRLGHYIHMPANHNKPHTAAAKARISAAKTGVPLLSKRRPSRIANGVEVFRCSRCRRFYPRGGFYRNKRTLLGLTSQCRKCHTAVSILSRDPERARTASRRHEAQRRARKAGARCDITPYALSVLESLWGSACLKCGSTKNLQWDHIVPLSKGGEHSVANHQRLCRKCNERKQARTADYRTDGQKKWAITFTRVDQ